MFYVLFPFVTITTLTIVMYGLSLYKYFIFNGYMFYAAFFMLSLHIMMIIINN